MALAETAELAVRMSLDDKRFLDPLNRIDKRLGAFSGAVNRNLGRAFDTAISRGVRALVGGFRSGVDALRELETVTAQSNAVVKSTGGVAGITAGRVRELAEKYEGLSAVIDDKVIQSGENILLTFTGIRKDAFEPALEAALNLSTAMDQDLKSSVVQIGKALNDPVKGLTSLGRAGVQFTEAQRKQIKELVKQNDLYGAQKIILRELEREFGGSFAATADTAAGKQAKLADAVEDVQKAFAEKLLPVVVRVSERITDYLAKPETLAFFQRLGDTIAGLFTEENLDTATSAIETAARVTGDAINAFNQLPPEIKALAIGALTLNKVTGGAVGGAAEAFGKLLGSGLKQIFAANVTVVGGNVTGGIPGTGGGGGGALGTAAKTVLPLAALAGFLEVVNAQGEADIAAGRTPAQYYQLPSGQMAYGWPPGALDAMKGTQENTSQTLGVTRDLGRDASQTLGVTRDLGVRVDASGTRSVASIDRMTMKLSGNLERLQSKITKEKATREAGDPLVHLLKSKKFTVKAEIAERGGADKATVGALNRMSHLQSRLASAQRAGDRDLAHRLHGKIDNLRNRVARGNDEMARKQSTANSRLGAIARKKTNLTVQNTIQNTTSVSVSDTTRATRYRSSTARSTRYTIL